MVGTFWLISLFLYLLVPETHTLFSFCSLSLFRSRRETYLLLLLFPFCSFIDKWASLCVSQNPILSENQNTTPSSSTSLSLSLSHFFLGLLGLSLSPSLSNGFGKQWEYAVVEWGRRLRLTRRLHARLVDQQSGHPCWSDGEPSTAPPPPDGPDPPAVVVHVRPSIPHVWPLVVVFLLLATSGATARKPKFAPQSRHGLVQILTIRPQFHRSRCWYRWCWRSKPSSFFDQQPAGTNQSRRHRRQQFSGYADPAGGRLFENWFQGSKRRRRPEHEQQQQQSQQQQQRGGGSEPKEEIESVKACANHSAEHRHREFPSHGSGIHWDSSATLHVLTFPEDQIGSVWLLLRAFSQIRRTSGPFPANLPSQAISSQGSAPTSSICFSSSSFIF